MRRIPVPASSSRRWFERALESAVCRRGVFSLLFDSGGTEVGTALAKHPLVKAGGFHLDCARGGKSVDGYSGGAPGADSVLCRNEQHQSRIHSFCRARCQRTRRKPSRPGLHTSFTPWAPASFARSREWYSLPQGNEAVLFREKLRQLVAASAPSHLLTASIHSSYDSAVAARKANGVVGLIAETSKAQEDTGFVAGSALFETSAATFIKSHLEAEIFGPTTLLVQHSSRDQILEIAGALEGHLTATIHGTEQDLRDFADLIAILENKVGRLVFNGFPTGLEVGHAHDSRSPASCDLDGRSTSVGTRAIFRFTWPVCGQGFPRRGVAPGIEGSKSPGNLAHGRWTNDSRGDPVRALDAKMIPRLKIDVVYRVLPLAPGVKSATPTLTSVPRALVFASSAFFSASGDVAGCSVQTP